MWHSRWCHDRLCDRHVQRGEEELQRSGLDYTIVRPGAHSWDCRLSLQGNDCDEGFVPRIALCMALTCWLVMVSFGQAHASQTSSHVSYCERHPRTVLQTHAGGLKNSLQAGEQEGAVVMKGPGSYGVPPKGKAGSILRRQVGCLCCWWGA